MACLSLSRCSCGLLSLAALTRLNFTFYYSSFKIWWQQSLFSEASLFISPSCRTNFPAFHVLSPVLLIRLYNASLLINFSIQPILTECPGCASTCVKPWARQTWSLVSWSVASPTTSGTQKGRVFTNLWYSASGEVLNTCIKRRIGSWGPKEACETNFTLNLRIWPSGFCSVGMAAGLCGCFREAPGVRSAHRFLSHSSAPKTIVYCWWIVILHLPNKYFMCIYNMLKCAVGNGDDQRMINQILYLRGI